MIEPKTDDERAAVAKGNLELDGIRLCFEGDCKVTIRRAGGDNGAFLQRYLANLSPYQLALEAGECSDATVIRATALTYAQAIITKIEPEHAPELPPEDEEGVVEWLLADEDRFRDIIAYAEDWRMFSCDAETRSFAMQEAA